MAAALQIWSRTFSDAFDTLPAAIRDAVQRKLDEMGTRLESIPHSRLRGRSEFKLRVGDYRVLYESTRVYEWARLSGLDMSDSVMIHYFGENRHGNDYFAGTDDGSQAMARASRGVARRPGPPHVAGG